DVERSQGAYDTDLEKADAIMLSVAEGLAGIKEEPAPFVAFKEFGESSINATLYFWIDTSEAGYYGSLDDVVKGIKTAFEIENIRIPYPTRTIHNQ
ncbi:MAG: mechanosensitive ion channel family protein, partial [Chloroflexota bacterium]